VYEQQAVGARKAMADYGVNLEIIGPVLGTSALVEETNNFIDNAISLSPDAIILEPWDPSMNAAVQRVHDAGIPVFCTSNPPEREDHYIAWIGTDNYNYGAAAADMIAQKTGGTANVCIMMSTLDILNQVEQKKGFEETIAKKYPGIKVVVTEADGADMSTALRKFEEVFQAYPEVDTVWMLEGTGGPAAAQIAQERNRKVLILDIDAVEQTIDLIGKGQIWATLAQNFYKRGYESVRMAYEYLANGNANSFNKTNDSGVVLINSDNVAAYEEDLLAAIRYKGTPLK
jgi:ribose transport system substrate-binding protein